MSSRSVAFFSIRLPQFHLVVVVFTLLVKIMSNLIRNVWLLRYIERHKSKTQIADLLDKGRA